MAPRHPDTAGSSWPTATPWRHPRRRWRRSWGRSGSTSHRCRGSGIYGESRTIREKGPERLAALRKLGLGIVYFGAETGDPVTLRDIKKGATLERQVEASHLVREAGMKLSVMVLLGLAGVEGSQRHAEATGSFLVEAAPTYGAALMLTPVPGTEIHDAWQSGDFALPGQMGHAPGAPLDAASRWTATEVPSTPTTPPTTCR